MCAMTEQELEKGMVVRLKSGGPLMVVRALSGSQAYCEWFTDTDRRQGTFEIAGLEIARDATSIDSASPRK